MQKALLFDLDGTLSETDSVHFPAWADILRPHGYEIDRDFFQKNISGRLNPDVAAEFMPGLTPEATQVICYDKEAHFRSNASGLEPLPGLLEFIALAKSSGLEIALVTNAPRDNVEVVIPALGLADVFGPIIVADEAPAGKPDPAPYLKALAELGIEADEAFAFEDSLSGMAASTGAGIPTVGIASTQRPEVLEEAGAFVVVDDFTDPRLTTMFSPGSGQVRGGRRQKS